MITGEYKASLDDKGRILVPSRVRAEIDEGSIVLTRGIDRCLWLFPPAEWQRIAGKLMDSTSIFQSRARMIQRRIIAPAQEAEFDKAGRINISPSLREYAGLQKECVILGIDSFLEIWDEGEYRAYWDQNESEFQQAAEELGKIIAV